MPTLCPTLGIGYQSFDTAGIPNNAGLIYFWVAGGTITPQATYTSSAGTIANANPIVLAADGRPPNEIWLADLQSYRIQIKTSGGTLLGDYDTVPI